MFLILGVSGCGNSKEAYLKKFESFVSVVEVDCESYSESKWESKEKKYEKLVGAEYEKFKKELNIEEQLKIVALKARYQAAKVKYHAIKALDKTEEGIQNFKKALDAAN